MNAPVRFVLTLTLAAGVCVGCAGAGNPRTMTVAQNEAAASADDRKADRMLCANGADAGDGAPCWAVNTPETQEAVSELRRKAAEHRNAAAVRQAEQDACGGVSEADRVQSPFSHREDIISVQPLVAHLPQGGTRDAGAVIIFRKVPRLTAPLFQKILDCHLARDAAFGFDQRELEYCPLNVNPLTFDKLAATVSESPNGFSVKLYASSEEVAHKVLARAQALVGSPRCLTTPVSNET